jgi:methyl-accepting chemotaxis protein
MKIGGKLILVGTLIIAIPLIVVAIIVENRAGVALQQLNDQQLVSRAQEISRTIDGMYAEELKLALSLAENPVVVAAVVASENRDSTAAVGKAVGHSAKAQATPEARPATEALSLLDSAKQLDAAYESISLADSSGDLLSAAGSNASDRNVGATGYFKEAMAGRTNMGTVVLSKATGKPVTPIAVPIHSGANVVGAVILSLRIDFLANIVAGDQVGRTGYVAVVDSAGMIIAHADPDLIMNMNILETEGDLANDIGKVKSGISHYVFKKVSREAAFATVKDTSWIVILTLPTSEYLAPISDIRIILILVAAAALALSFVLYTLFARSISVPLFKAVAFAQTVASGDFTHQLPIKGRDEVGALAEALNGMCVKLSEILAVVQQDAEELAASSSQISGSASKLSEGAQNQASGIEKTSASMEELYASVEQVAQHAQSQAAAAEQGASSMNQALGTVQVVSTSLEEISALAKESVQSAAAGSLAVQSVVEGINTIARGSERIAGILTVISDIADQTNLLALNASIEAARAGEHGRGFAVVASEVSKLADRSSSSTREIDTLIKESIRNVTKGVETAQSSEKAMQQIRESSQKVNEMIAKVTESMGTEVGAIKELVKSLSNISEMSKNISASTEEQTTNARQMSETIEGINEITQSSASGAEQMSASTERLLSMARDLQRLVVQFKIRENPAGPTAGELDPPLAAQQLSNLEGGSEVPETGLSAAYSGSRGSSPGNPAR